MYYCNLDRTLQLSQRMAGRNVPSAPLQPQFSIRPVSTKYALMPIFDRRAPTHVPIKTDLPYEISRVFNPGSAQGPWSGFATNVNTESVLRNQFFGLQRCEQGNYIPGSESDLSQVSVTGGQERQPYPGLFKSPPLPPSNPNPCNLDPEIFNNSTRAQVKALPMVGKTPPAHGGGLGPE